jgi:hypothetical protein
MKNVMDKIDSTIQNPFCQHCGSGLTYVRQYSRWWCNICQRYIQPARLHIHKEVYNKRHIIRFEDSKTGFKFKRRESVKVRKQVNTGRVEFRGSDRLIASRDEDGKLGHTEFRVRGDRVYPRGSGMPAYRITGDRLYRTAHHPDGAGGGAVYRLERTRERLRHTGTGLSSRLGSRVSTRYKRYTGYKGFKSNIKKPSIHHDHEND